MSSAKSSPVLVGRPVRLSELVDVARSNRPVALCPEARARIEASRRPVDRIASAGDDGPAVYGVNTGFGALAETRIAESDVAALQRNLVRSHACGVGPDLSRAEVRAMIFLRAQVVAMGLGLSLLATIYPSWRAAKTDPVEALRNE